MNNGIREKELPEIFAKPDFRVLLPTIVKIVVLFSMLLSL